MASWAYGVPQRRTAVSLWVLHACAGYHYTAPFLPDALVDTSRSHVRPLYQHLFHAALRERLTFIGLPFKIVPFPQFELQTKLVARVLSGRAQLPGTEGVESWMESHYRCGPCAAKPIPWSRARSCSECTWTATWLSLRP